MGTVEFADHQMVEDAIRQFDNTVFMDRDIFVKQDRAPPGNNRRERSPRRDEGGRYGDEGGRYGDEGGRYGDEGGRYGESYPPPPSERSRRQQQNGYEVFVINLPYSTTWQDLKDMFREAGDVLRADIELNYKGFSRGFGNVFFATKEEMYKAIDLFNGCELDGRVLEVREGRFNYLVDEARGERSEPAESRYRDNEGPRDEPVEDVDMGPEGSEREMTQEQSLPPPQNSTFTEGIVGGGDKNNIIFCSNLPFATSSNDLYELFESFGRVEKAEFKFDPTGGPTGNAVVEYSDADTAELCISKLNNYNYGGNDLAVSYAQHDTEL